MCGITRRFNTNTGNIQFTAVFIFQSKILQCLFNFNVEISKDIHNLSCRNINAEQAAIHIQSIERHAMGKLSASQITQSEMAVLQPV